MLNLLLRFNERPILLVNRPFDFFSGLKNVEAPVASAVPVHGFLCVLNGHWSPSAVVLIMGGAGDTSESVVAIDTPTFSVPPSGPLLHSGISSRRSWVCSPI